MLLKDFRKEPQKLRHRQLTEATNKSVEIYIDNISGYGDAGNTEVSYVKFNKDRKNRYSNNFGIGNSNAVGAITYTSLTGLPSGLKAYFSEDKTEVLVRGKFANIERGTTAVLSGYDEKGTVFYKENYLCCRF